MPIQTLLRLLLRALLLGRQALVLENLALRQQLAVLERKRPHPRLTDRDRRFWLSRAAFGAGVVGGEAIDEMTPTHCHAWASSAVRKSRP